LPEVAVAVNKTGLSGTLFYLVAYGFTTLASFAVVGLVRDSSGEATHLAQWAGLGKRSPVVGGVFAVLLFALAGIPLTSGFMAKFAVFTAAIQGGATALVIVGVMASAITAFFYARVVVLMFFQEPAEDGPSIAVPSASTAIAIAVGLAVTLLLGVLPQPVLDLADKAALFVR
jgi:NADH-quinone oxidoreductase subunit N